MQLVSYSFARTMRLAMGIGVAACVSGLTITLATWSPDLFFIEELNDVNASFYFEHFIKLKVLAYYASELEPSIWFKQIQVIWDPEGMIEPMRQSSLALELSVNQAMIDHVRVRRA